jgi:hypothetical protein
MLCEDNMDVNIDAAWEEGSIVAGFLDDATIGLETVKADITHPSTSSTNGRRFFFIKLIG